MRRMGQLAIVLVSVVLGTSCALIGLDRAISMEVSYPDGQTSDVTIRYTVPPPPPGKVYVLWILDPDTGQSQRIGVVEPGTDRVVQARVGFEARGAVVSIESSPEPPRMNNVWALKVGQVDAGPTPSAAPAPAGGPLPG